MGRVSLPGARVAEYFATKNHDGDKLDPTAALLRSISSDAVHDMLRDAIDEEVIKKLSSWLGGKNAESRAALIVAHPLGFDMLRRVIEVNALSPPKAKASV